MITNTRLNNTEESKHEKDGVTVFQKVHSLHVVLDANIPEIDKSKFQNLGPNIINTSDLGIVNAPHIGAEIWDG